MGQRKAEEKKKSIEQDAARAKAEAAAKTIEEDIKIKEKASIRKKLQEKQKKEADEQAAAQRKEEAVKEAVKEEEEAVKRAKKEETEALEALKNADDEVARLAIVAAAEAKREQVARKAKEAQELAKKEEEGEKRKIAREAAKAEKEREREKFDDLFMKFESLTGINANNNNGTEEAEKSDEVIEVSLATFKNSIKNTLCEKATCSEIETDLKFAQLTQEKAEEATISAFDSCIKKGVKNVRKCDDEAKKVAESKMGKMTNIEFQERKKNAVLKSVIDDSNYTAALSELVKNKTKEIRE